MKSVALLLTVVLVQLALGDDLYWIPNSNWNNPSNWKLGRTPCGNDIPTLPENSMVFLDDDMAIQTLQLPENGEILLGANIAIRLTEEAEDNCEGAADQSPNSGVSENEFIGGVPSYWECRDNWRRTDNSQPQHPPCGNDRAFFEEAGSYFSVKANETVYVRSLRVRGSQISSQDELDPAEFQVEVNVLSECGADPSLCPCPSDAGCASGPLPSVATPEAVTAGATVGILVGLVVLCGLIILIILAIIMYKKRIGRGVFGYKKDELLDNEEEPQVSTTAHPTPESRNFDNPVYETTTIVPGDLSSSQEKPKPVSSSIENLDVNNYEVASGELASKAGHEENFVKVDLSEFIGLENEPSSPEDPGYLPSRSVDTEMVEDGGDKNKGKKSGKYERF